MFDNSQTKIILARLWFTLFALSIAWAVFIVIYSLTVPFESAFYGIAIIPGMVIYGGRAWFRWLFSAPGQTQTTDNAPATRRARKVIEYAIVAVATVIASILFVEIENGARKNSSIDRLQGASEHGPWENYRASKRIEGR